MTAHNRAYNYYHPQFIDEQGGTQRGGSVKEHPERGSRAVQGAATRPGRPRAPVRLPAWTGPRPSQGVLTL